MAEENGIESIPMLEVKSYLREFYKRNNNRLPSIKAMATQFNVSEYKMLEVFRILVHEGFLRRNQTRYKLSDIGIDDTPPLEPAPPELPVVEEEKPKVDLMTAPWILMTMRIIIALIGLGAIGVSIYRTEIWLADYLPPALAMILSVIMVVFATMAFEAVLMLRSNRQHGMAVSFFILWIISMSFCMVSAVAGQYNQKIKVEIVQTADTAGMTYKRTIYESYQADATTYQKQLDSQQAQRDATTKLLAQFDTVEKQKADTKTYNALVAQAAGLDASMKKLNANLLDIRGKMRDALKTETNAGLTAATVVQDQSFYVWVSGLLKNKMEPKYVQFWLSIFPVIFVDLIAPFSLAFALYQKQGEKKRRKKLLDFFSNYH